MSKQLSNDHPNLLKKVTTGEESWVHGYDIETKAQIIPMEASRRVKTEKARQVRSNVPCSMFSSIACLF